MEHETGRQLTKEDIVEAIIGAAATVAPNVGALDADSRLMGKNARLDSIGFVMMLVRLEEDLGNAVDLSSSLLGQDGVEEARHPFFTVNSLAEHIRGLMSARP
jgi:hypothetical protein